MLCFALFEVHGQVNLVPNFSFENKIGCPDTEDQINLAVGWSKFSNSSSTPDYYNICAPNTSFGIPQSGNEYQQERRNCGAYAGLVTFAASPLNYRECIGIQLDQSLQIGQKYFVSFYTAMAQLKLGVNYFGIPSNNIGLLLSTHHYNASSPVPINNFAHVYSESIINDSITWTRISGSFIADSAYNYIAVGNFFEDGNTDTLNYNCPTCQNFYSYYFVDDICLSTDSLYCNATMDILQCTNSISADEVNEFNIFPNPVEDILNISLNKDQNFRVEIYNSLGTFFFNGLYIHQNIIQLSTEQLLSGVYFLNIKDLDQNTLIHHKFFKQ